MVRRRHRLLSAALAILMVFALTAVAVGATASVSAAAGDTVYCKNAGNWSQVYCYMWTDGSGNNSDWPGQQMTKGSDGTWSYAVTGAWNKIIFNDGSGNQTSDMDYSGNGRCYDVAANSWSVLDPNPTQNTQPTQQNPTSVVTPTTPAPTGLNTIFCQNDANWDSVSVYMWSDAGNNGGWPGSAMTDMGDGLYSYEFSGSFPNVIFNNGGSIQTADLKLPGTGYCYNNSTGEWTIQDSSILNIKKFSADLTSPQYTGVDVALSMTAGGGEGDLSYKFSVKSGTVTTVLADFSADSSVVWTPATPGNYTLVFTVKDSTGETVEKTMPYTIKDIAAEVKPVIRSVAVTPTDSTNGEILKGGAATVSITAGGGNTGTKLLFYKVTVTDPSGKTANVPYYTLKNEYKFTPATLGEYEIAVSVQGSDNSVATKTMSYQCVESLSAPGELKAGVSVSGTQTVGGTATVTAAASGGTAPYTYQFEVNGKVVKAYSSSSSYALSLTEAGTYTVKTSVKDATGKISEKTTTVTVSAVPGGDYLKGDADCSGEVNVRDATAIQKHAALLAPLSGQALTNANVDGNSEVNVKDATMIQKHIASIDVNW